MWRYVEPGTGRRRITLPYVTPPPEVPGRNDDDDLLNCDSSGNPLYTTNSIFQMSSLHGLQKYIVWLIRNRISLDNRAEEDGRANGKVLVGARAYVRQRLVVPERLAHEKAETLQHNERAHG